MSLLSLGPERVVVVASSLVMWHERGAGGGADVGGMAVERAAAVLTWHTKRQRQRLAPTVMWHVVALWMHDEVGGGGQQGCNSPVDRVSWSAHAPYVVVVFESIIVVVCESVVVIVVFESSIIIVFELVVVIVHVRWRRR